MNAALLQLPESADFSEGSYKYVMSGSLLGVELKDLRSVPVDDFIHKRMLEAVRLYIIIGGMPAAVQKYLDTDNLRKVYEEQRGIIRTYKRDITKYDLHHKLQIEEIYDLIPSELDAKNKRFILKELNEKARFSKYEEGFLWLKDAGVAIPAYNV